METAFYRNRFVAALADKIFVAYAAPSSKTEQFCRQILGWEKAWYTLESDMTQALMALGAQPLTASQAGSELV